MVRHALLATVFALGLATSALAAPSRGDPRDNVLSSETADFAIFCYEQAAQLLSEGAFAFTIDGEHTPEAEEERINLTTEFVSIGIRSTPNLREGVLTGSAFMVFQPSSNSWTVYGPDYAANRVTKDPKVGCGKLTVDFAVIPELRRRLPPELGARFKKGPTVEVKPVYTETSAQPNRDFLRKFFEGPQN